MGSVSRTMALMGRAMRPGTSLKHNNESLQPVDALYALGRASDPIGALIVHAKLTAENLDAVHQVVMGIAATIFAKMGWEIHRRKNRTPEQLLHLFAQQVIREYLGEPCPECGGHGVRGQLHHDRRTDRGTPCKPCGNAGFVLTPTRSSCIVLKGPIMVRHICPACRGKRFLELAEQAKAGKIKTCQTCAGAGVRLDSSRVRGSVLGFDQQHILRVWGIRFNTVLAEVRRIDRQTFSECVEFLSTGEGGN